MAEIAIFGGTFDPPTRTHEAIAAACLEHPVIDEVWLMPSGVRVDKPAMQPDEVRLGLLRTVHEKVFENNVRLRISDFEFNLPRPTHTSATVAALEQAFPENHWWFVFGADSYHAMPEWNSGTTLQKTLGMLVVPRAGYELPPKSDNVQHLFLPPDVDITISSSQIREAAALGRPIEHLVARGTADIIEQRQLYNAVE